MISIKSFTGIMPIHSPSMLRCRGADKYAVPIQWSDAV